LVPIEENLKTSKDIFPARIGAEKSKNAAAIPETVSTIGMCLSR
jgi:hypothetical protein